MSCSSKWPETVWPTIERSATVDTVVGGLVQTPPIRVPSIGVLQMGGNDEARAPSDLLTAAAVVDVVDGVPFAANTFQATFLLYTRLAPPAGTRTVAPQLTEAYQLLAVSRNRAWQGQLPVPIGDVYLVAEVTQAAGGVVHTLQLLASFAVLSRRVQWPCDCGART